MSDLIFNSQTYVLRPLTEEDVSSKWASWFTEKETSDFLNMRSRQFSFDELKSYIERYDQKRSILLGIFHRCSQSHIGIFSSIQSDSGREVLFNLLIGEKKYRSGAGLLEFRKLSFDLLDYFFFEKKYVAVYASVLTDNKKLTSLLQLGNWHLVKRMYIENQSSYGEDHIEVSLFRITVSIYLKMRIRFGEPMMSIF